MKTKRNRTRIGSALVALAAIAGAVGASAGDVGARIVCPAEAHASALRLHTGIPSLAVSPVNGRLWVSFYGGVTPGEDSNAYVPLMTSGDGGKTWKTVCVAEPAAGRRVFDPELWVAPDGRLRWTIASRACAKTPTDLKVPYGGIEGDDSSDDRLLMAELSAEDEPSSLPAPRQIADGVMMCKPIVMRDGTWLFPVAHWYREPSACFFASTDGGKTFSLRGGVSHFPKENRLYDEQTVVERTDGSLLTFIRAKKAPTCLESVSTDGGRTWTVGKKARFENTSSRHFLRRLRSGILLLVKNGPIDKDVGRRSITAFLSDDEGETWKGGLLLDDRQGTSYPDGDQAADGTIYVTYDHNRLVTQEILFASFTEDEVLAGRFQRPESVQKGVVMRHPLGSSVPGRTLDLGGHLIACDWNLSHYEILNPHFKKAFAFLRRKDLKRLKPGRYEIDGANCYAMVQDVQLTPLADVEKVEVHHRYIDIQMPLTGEETHGVCTCDRLHFPETFDVEKDVGFFTAPVRPMTVKPGKCAIFFPWDGAHAPNHCTGEPKALRKVVVKVKAE